MNRKFLKTTLLLVMAASMMLLLSACGGKGGSSKTVSVDAAKLADELKATVTSGELTETASEVALSTYFLDSADVESCTAYAGSGIASEVLILQRKDSLSAGNAEKKLQTHVDNQEELYASYNQEEAAKLKKAVIKSAGAYTVLCVSDDADKAADILKSYGF